MSWQAYVDTQLIASGQIAQAAIVSAADGAVWAASPDFALRAYNGDVTQEDGSERSEAINEATNLVSYATSGQKPGQGLRLNGEKYTVLRSMPDPFTIYGKKPKGGCCIVKTNMCLIIGTYSEDAGHTSASCNITVENLAEYLRSAGC